MKGRNLTFVLAGLATLGPFSIDTYLPSFGAVAEHLGVTLVQVQGTLTFYLVALAPSFGWLVTFRAQGFAAGAGIIVGRAIIHDRFEGPQAHKLMA